ncbi:response regulator with CheY-like receiver domain and winged-helix DNA-binding domain [Leptolyngbya sp. PCC 7375]|nr:response regulator with CheY-like receiver domain and winged-helix DNA-binding domain [Leptolyngbya sp. PCC 7375]EKU99742.1 response regulator with CheY-like receiver domain and winged-helix DNA-binding domain [Leptolyngbya sp. PCC 7375]
MATILIVEDDSRIAAFVSKGLEKAGYQTQVASDGNQVLPLALSGKFDLILLDLGLSGMDGREVLKEIRTQAVQIPVIVVTALDNDEVREDVLSLGAQAFIAKPFRFNSLLTCVRAHLREGEISAPQTQ